MIIGTAGHIDHGKTSLIRRLTGKDTDRLPEEKRRGISIELGYAYLPIDIGEAADPAHGSATGRDDAEAVIGFVDVPGHEKFVHAMVSGATGIDMALLVIAADDGPMPQTREHLEILRLLGITDGAVVLTKIDMVDAAAGDMAVAMIAGELEGTPSQKWPLFPVSSVTGEGMDALRSYLTQKARDHQNRSSAGHFRLAVDRAFSIAGLGTIVTGTAHSGRVEVGDDVHIITPGARSARVARVRSIHAQDRQSSFGSAGQRVAMNLVGLSVDDVPRGSWICGQGLDSAVVRFDMAMESSALHGRTISQGLEVHLHHGAHDTLARLYALDRERIEPGESAMVSVVLSEPVAVCKGDRVVVRDSQAQSTLGGGLVLDVTPPARGKRTPARLKLLEDLRDLSTQDAMARLVDHAPVSVRRLVGGWNLREPQVMQTAGMMGLVCAAGTLFSRQRWDELAQRVVNVIDETHLREPEMPGIEINRCRRVAAPSLDADAFAELVNALVLAETVVRKGAFLARPSHRVELSAAERHLWQSIAPLLNDSPYNPPRVRDIAKITNIPEAEIRANLRRVARIGEVSLVALDHFFLAHRVAEMADIAKELFEAHGAVRAAEFRDRIGGGRKVAIQILEFFDRVGYTRRIRDDHLIRQHSPFAKE